jgi:hypothetical protein
MTERAQKPKDRKGSSFSEEGVHVKGWGIGVWIVSFVALVTIGGSFAADWNETHIFNPYWPPHAKFHNAQSMLMGVLLGGISLWFLWLTNGNRLSRLKLGVLLASLYWVSQGGAILFPGTAFFDPEFADRFPEIAGVTIEPNQVVLSGFLLSLLCAGYYLERRRLERRTEPTETSVRYEAGPAGQMDRNR